LTLHPLTVGWAAVLVIVPNWQAQTTNDREEPLETLK